MKVTNVSKGPRGLNTESGPVLLEPGETADLELSAAEQKVAKDTKWFEFGGAAAKAAEQDDNHGKPHGKAKD